MAGTDLRAGLAKNNVNRVLTVDQNGQLGNGVGQDLRHHAKVERSNNYNLPDNTLLALPFNNVIYDLGDFFNSNNPSRLTAPVQGVYNISAIIRYSANTQGTRNFRIEGSGSIGRIVFISKQALSSGVTVITSSINASMDAGEFLECNVFQDSGSEIQIENGVSAISISKIY